MAKNVALPDDLHTALKERAQSEGMKMTGIVERAVREWLLKWPKRKRAKV
jgi:hypothetical protein